MFIEPFINIASLSLLGLWTICGWIVLFGRLLWKSDPLIEKQIFLYGCLSLATMQLGMSLALVLGFYTPLVQWMIFSVPMSIGLFGLKHSHCNEKDTVYPRLHWTYLPIGLLLLGYFWFACPPPWMRDSLTYHLALARQYAIYGQYTETDFVVFSFFPQGWQSLLTLLHMPQTGEALWNPRMLSVFITGLTSMGLYGLTLERTSSRIWSMTSSLLYLLTPTVFEFGTAAYVMSWLSALFLWITIAIEDRRSPLHLGLLVGLACSIKYSALILPFFGLAYLYTPSKKYQPNRPRRVASFIMGILLTGSLFYIRNWLQTGNPVFPTLYGIFGGDGWDSWRAMAYESTLDNYGMGRGFLDYLLLPFRLFLSRDMLGAFQGSLGLGWLILIFCAWSEHRGRIHWALWWIVGWFAFWALQVQQVRFFAPILPVILFVSIPTLSQRYSKGWIGLLGLALVWGYSPLQTLLHNQQGQVFWETEDATRSDAFLSHRLPENFPIYQYLNQQETQKVWLIWMRGYHYYLDKPARIDNVFGAYRFENLLWNSPSSEDLLQQLQRDKISHLVINWRFFLADDNADRLGENATQILQSRFSEMIQKDLFHPIQQWGPVWVYSVSESSENSY